MKQIILFIYFILFSAFSQAQDKNVFDIARKGTLSDIQEIFNQTPDLINAINDNKATPLILACYRNNEAVALYLSDKVLTVLSHGNIYNQNVLRPHTVNGI